MAGPALAAHRLFFAGQTVVAEQAAPLLGADLLAQLLRSGVLVAVGEGVRARVLAAPFAGRVYFADPVALQDHPEYCYLGRSTFVTAQFLRHGRARAPAWPPAGGRLQDLGCGAGVAALACADGFDQVLGTDIVARCLRFARVNAAVNDVTHARFAYSDVFSDVDGTFDLITANTPCVWAAAEPGVPRIYASGGGEFGLQLPLRMITGGLDRLRPGGTMLAVLTAPVRGGERYAATALERICAERRAEATLYPLLAEYEWRNDRLYRAHGISRIVRYLALLRLGAGVGVSFGRFDTTRLLGYQVRALSTRMAARAFSLFGERTARRPAGTGKPTIGHRPQRGKRRRSRHPRSASVTEPERGLGRGAHRTVGSGVGYPLDTVFGVVDRDRAEAFLEVGQAGRATGFAEVVGAAAVFAGQLDPPPLQQFGGAGRTGQRAVDRAASVMGGGAEQGDVGGGGPVVDVGDQDHQRGTEVASDGLELRWRIPVRRPPTRQRHRLMLTGRPAKHR